MKIFLSVVVWLISSNAFAKGVLNIQFSKAPVAPSVSKFQCKGKIASADVLKNTGIEAKNLEKGVPCLVGDFDGNGSKDFALFHPMDGNLQAFQMRVVLTKGKDVLNVLPAVIRRDSGDERGFFLAEVLSKKKIPGSFKKLACKFPKHDFVFEHGEGANNHVVAYDAQKEAFVVFSSCPSENF